MQQAKPVTSGLVLRQTVTKETDLILTVLTPDLGKIPVIARGARRKNSRLAAACQLLAYSELTVYQKGAWYMLDEASTIELFDGVRQDFENLALASFFAELTESVAEEGSPAPELLRLLLNALYALGVLHKEPLLVKTAFTLRLLALAGFEPLADGCAVCGAADPADARLDPVQGVLRCAACGADCTPFTFTNGYTIAFDEPHRVGVTLPRERAEELARDAARVQAVPDGSVQNPIVAFAPPS